MWMELREIKVILLGFFLDFQMELEVAKKNEEGVKRKRLPKIKGREEK